MKKPLLTQIFKTEYQAYHGAKKRCNCPTISDYRLYGGRGIQFLFSSFQEFWDVVGPRPSSEHSLDRIDVNGHYEPDNVRWATAKQQAENRRNNRYLTYKGETRLLKHWLSS